MCFCESQLALLNPIENPDLELAIVMLIVPFFVNVSLLCFSLYAYFTAQQSLVSIPVCVFICKIIMMMIINYI